MLEMAKQLGIPINPENLVQAGYKALSVQATEKGIVIRNLRDVEHLREDGARLIRIGEHFGVSIDPKFKAISDAYRI